MATPAQPQPLNDLVTKIRTAYPGSYDDMDDATLTKQVLAKYPQYSDLAAPKIQKPQAPQMQPSFTAQALAGGPPDSSPMNPTQPGEQWAIQNPTAAAGAAGIGALGAVPMTAEAVLPHVMQAAQHPVVKQLLKAGAKKLAEGAAGAAGAGGSYVLFKKIMDALK